VKEISRMIKLTLENNILESLLLFFRSLRMPSTRTESYNKIIRAKLAHS